MNKNIMFIENKIKEIKVDPHLLCKSILLKSKKINKEDYLKFVEVNSGEIDTKSLESEKIGFTRFTIGEMLFATAKVDDFYILLGSPSTPISLTITEEFLEYVEDNADTSNNYMRCQICEKEVYSTPKICTECFNKLKLKAETREITVVSDLNKDCYELAKEGHQIMFMGKKPVVLGKYKSGYVVIGTKENGIRLGLPTI